MISVILYPSTLILSSNVPVCFVADEVLSDGRQKHSTGRRGGGGGGGGGGLF